MRWPEGPGIAKAAGFDYVELGTTELTALSDADFERGCRAVKAVGIPTPNANLFLPGSLKLTGPEAATPEQQMAYVTKAFTRLERLGVEDPVLRQRRRAPGAGRVLKDEAFAQLVAFGKRIAPEAKAHGITVVIEPLRRQETNIINTAAEGFDAGEGDRPSELRAAGRLLPSGQRAGGSRIILEAAGPHPASAHGQSAGPRVSAAWDEFDYAPFFANLRTIGYAGRMSIEASSPDVPAQAPKSIELLRRAFAGTVTAPTPAGAR